MDVDDDEEVGPDFPAWVPPLIGLDPRNRDRGPWKKPKRQARGPGVYNVL